MVGPILPRLATDLRRLLRSKNDEPILFPLPRRAVGVFEVFPSEKRAMDDREFHAWLYEHPTSETNRLREPARLEQLKVSALERKKRPRRKVIQGLPPMKRFYAVRRRQLVDWLDTEEFINEVQCDLEAKHQGAAIALTLIHRIGGGKGVHLLAVFRVEVD